MVAQLGWQLWFCALYRCRLVESCFAGNILMDSERMMNTNASVNTRKNDEFVIPSTFILVAPE